VPYAGKRWGVIGSGASGVQITEALAWAGCDVTQFIRRAQWVHIRENPHSTWYQRLRVRLPFGYRREQRRLWQFINEGDRWRLEPGPQREAMEREFRSYLDCIKDSELKKKLTPDYNLGCTRIPKSDKNYYEAVQLPNAHIVKGQIARIVPDGVVMADGTHVDLDVLVYATGFDAHAYMRPMTVTGLNGTTIDEAWREKIYSYGGIALPGFPNLFMLYGPFAPVNNVPVPLGLDQEIACIMRLIAEARARRASGRADRRRDREIPRPARRRVSRYRLGRRLQELVYRRSGHAGPVAAAAERAQGILRRGAGGRFSVHSHRAGGLNCRKRLGVRIHAGLDCLQLYNHVRVDDSGEARHLFSLPLGQAKKHVQRAQVEESAVPVSICLLV